MVRQYSDINNVYTPNTLIHSLVRSKPFKPQRTTLMLLHLMILGLSQTAKLSSSSSKFYLNVDFFLYQSSPFPGKTMFSYSQKACFRDANGVKSNFFPKPCRGGLPTLAPGPQLNSDLFLSVRICKWYLCCLLICKQNSHTSMSKVYESVCQSIFPFLK